MRKVLIHSNYRPSNTGGIELVVRQLVELSLQNNILVSCFFGDERNSKERVSETCTYIARRILLKVRGACVLSYGNTCFLLQAMKAHLVIYQEPYPTLWPALLLISRLRRTRTIVLVHAKPQSDAIVTALYSRIAKIVFKRCTIVTTSPNLQKTIIKSMNLEASVVPLCLPDNFVVSKRPVGLPSSYVLFVGRMASYKGIDVLLEAANRLPEIPFVLAGQGPLSDKVKEAIREGCLNNITHIARTISDAEKYGLIEGCKFLVFPSTSVNEAFGLVQLEAMSKSKPIVNTFLNTGVNYVAPDGVCAVTVKPFNSFELEDAVRGLWNDDDKCAKLGQAAFDRFSEYFSPRHFNSVWTETLLGQNGQQ